MTNRAAIITGSTSGIGLGIATSFAEAGYNIVLNGFGDADEIEKTRQSLETQYGIKAVYSGADLTKLDQIEALIDLGYDTFGNIDVLVNNAGIQHVSPIEDFPVEKWDFIISLNLSAAFHTTRLVFKRMKEKGFGRIINIASAHGLVASPFKSAYVSAKHGIIGLTKTAALEGAEFGVTVNAICPGYVLTPLVQKQIPDTAKARGITEEEVKRDVLLAAQPTKEFVTVEQLGAAALLLASEAGGSINGIAMPVDGGWTAQ